MDLTLLFNQFEKKEQIAASLNFQLHMLFKVRSFLDFIKAILFFSIEIGKTHPNMGFSIIYATTTYNHFGDLRISSEMQKKAQDAIQHFLDRPVEIDSVKDISIKILRSIERSYNF